MKKIVYVILILTVGTWIFGTEDQTDAPPKETALTDVIDDGFFLEGADGWLKKDTASEVWSFVPDKAIKAGENKTIPADHSVLMLPCAVLEQMTTLADSEDQLYIRLWAMFTKYKHANYLYSVYFLPIRQDSGQPQADTLPSETTPPSDIEAPKNDSPREESIIPQEILTQIKSTQMPDLNKFQQIAQVTGDTNLVGRTGYLTAQDGNCIFQSDGFGMKIDSRQLVLLPNQARQEAEIQLTQNPGRQRYNVSGLLTTCNGRKYLLIRRATRTFTHGNFTP